MTLKGSLYTFFIPSSHCFDLFLNLIGRVMLIQWHTTYLNKNIYTLNRERACSKPQRMALERVKTRGFRWGPSASGADHIRQHEPNSGKKRAEAPRPHCSRGPQRAQTPLIRRRCLRRNRRQPCKFQRPAAQRSLRAARNSWPG